MEGVEDPATVGRRVRRWGVGKSSRGGGTPELWATAAACVDCVGGDGKPLHLEAGGKEIVGGCRG